MFSQRPSEKSSSGSVTDMPKARENDGEALHDTDAKQVDYQCNKTDDDGTNNVSGTLKLQDNKAIDPIAGANYGPGPYANLATVDATVARQPPLPVPRIYPSQYFKTGIYKFTDEDICRLIREKLLDNYYPSRAAARQEHEVPDLPDVADIPLDGEHDHVTDQDQANDQHNENQDDASDYDEEEE